MSIAHCKNAKILLLCLKPCQVMTCCCPGFEDTGSPTSRWDAFTLKWKFPCPQILDDNRSWTDTVSDPMSFTWRIWAFLQCDYYAPVFIKFYRHNCMYKSVMHSPSQGIEGKEVMYLNVHLLIFNTLSMAVMIEFFLSVTLSSSLMCWWQLVSQSSINHVQLWWHVRPC